MSRSSSPHLVKALGLFPATTLVVGSVIGSGIFVSTASMARTIPTGWQLIGVWIFTGVITAFGALTQAEISSRLPVTGGLYSYLRAVFGDMLAFFYGWANFMIAGSGAIAAIAFIFAGYLGELIPLWQAPKDWQEWAVHIPYLGTLYPAADLGIKCVGALLILALTTLNVMGVKLGSLVQSISTTAKTLAMLLLVIVAFFFSKTGSWQNLSQPSTTAMSAMSVSPTSILSLVAIWFTSMGAAFWAYDGWGNISYVGGEVRDAQKNLPRAILLGTSIVITIYLLVNLAYLYVLPMSAISSAPGDRVASAMMGSVLGSKGVLAIALLILLCTFDTVNSSILANARVYFAMGNEGLFWKRAGLAHTKHHTPATALWMQGAWSIVLLVSGSFDLITSMYVFVNWLFYLLIPTSLFILRARERKLVELNSRIFRVPAYPWLPIAFAIFTFAYLLQTLITDIQGYQAHTQPAIKSLMGLALVLLGTPLYIFLKKSHRS